MAEDESIIVGYEMPFKIEHLNQMPFWKPFIKSIKNLKYDGKNISEYKIVIAGQICIARDHKRRGIAQDLHKYLIEMLREDYDLLISEVSYQNPRSLHVSTTKLGYHITGSYKEKEKTWHIVLQDIRTI